MKRLTVFITFLTLFFSCKKKDETVKNLSLDYALIGTDNVVQKKGSSFFVGVIYQQPAETISLTVNGINAHLVKKSFHINTNDPQALFEVAPLNTVGDYKIIFSVKNDGKTYTKESNVRIVDNFSIATIWQSLDKAYIKSKRYVTYRTKIGDCEIYNTYSPNNADANSLELGIYSKTFPESNAYNYIGNTLISGLYGDYGIQFKNDALYSIYISTPELLGMSKTEIFTELDTLYGNPTTSTTSSYVKRIYQHGAFDIEVKEYSGSEMNIVASITKVR